MKKRETRYQVHVFICTREKSDGSKSCSQGNAKEIKDKLKEIALEKKNGCQEYESLSQVV